MTDKERARLIEGLAKLGYTPAEIAFMVGIGEQESDEPSND